MLLCSIFLLLLSNSLNFRRDISIHYSRIGIVIQLYCIFFCYNNLFISYLDPGVVLFGGLFNISSIVLIFNILIFLVSLFILNLISFYPKNYLLNKYLTFSVIFNYKYTLFIITITCLICFISFFINIFFFIMNVIWLFVISYYFYNLFKNPVFLKNIKSFVKWFFIFIIVSLCIIILLILTASVALAESPELEILIENLAIAKENYNIGLNNHTDKVKDANIFYKTIFGSTEFNVVENKFIPSLKPGVTDAEFDAKKDILFEKLAEIKRDANNLISILNKIDGFDSEIHRINNTTYNNSYYNELREGLKNYRSIQWIIKANR